MTSGTVSLTGSTGNALAADRFGDPTNPPVLLAHGGGQTRHAWGSTAEVLAENGFHAVSIDQRGHGDSEWVSDGDYRIDTYANDLVTVAATFDHQPAVVGASLGGMAGLIAEGEAMRSRNAGVFSSLILVDITPVTQESGRDRIRSFMTERMEEGFGSLQEVADAVAAYQPHRTRPVNVDTLAKNVRLHDDGRYRWHWDPQFMSGGRSARSNHDPERNIACAKALTLPTMLVRGRMSDLVTEELAEQFRQMVPHADYVDVEDAAHMVAGDRNDVFTKAVLAFLSSE